MRRRESGIAVTAAVVAAIVVTLATGSPPRLPAIALHSDVLFHVERTVALVGGTLAVIVATTRAWGGELPAELSAQGIRYRETTASAVEELGEDLKAIAADISDLSARIDRIEDPA